MRIGNTSGDGHQNEPEIGLDLYPVNVPPKKFIIEETGHSRPPVSNKYNVTD